MTLPDTEKSPPKAPGDSTGAWDTPLFDEIVAQHADPNGPED